MICNRKAPDCVPELLCFGASKLNRFAAEAIGTMVVDDATCLHPGVDDHRTDEFEATFSKGRRYLFGERCLRGNRAMVFDRLIACHVPDPGGEVFAGLRHSEIDARPVDGLLDLGSGTNDVFVLKETGNIGLAHAGNFLRIEVVKGFTEGVAFAQDGEPGEASLKTK